VTGNPGGSHLKKQAGNNHFAEKKDQTLKLLKKADR
jgi:hypothetical protein